MKMTYKQLLFYTLTALLHLGFASNSTALFAEQDEGIEFEPYEGEDVEPFVENETDEESKGKNLCDDPDHIKIPSKGCADPIWNALCKTKGSGTCGSLSPATCADLSKDPCCHAKYQSCTDTCATILGTPPDGPQLERYARCCDQCQAKRDQCLQ